MKKLLSILLCVVFIFTMTACNQRNTEKLNEQGYYEGTLEIKILKAGYGVQWLYDIAAAYEKEYTNCKVKITETTDRDAIKAIVRSTANTSDIIVSVDSMFANQNDGYLYDLSEVFNSVQEGYDVSLKERMNQSIWEYYETEDGKVYQMPWTTGFAGFVYNKTILDEVFGEGNYSMPRTTDELLELCEDVLTTSNGTVAPFVMYTEGSYSNNVFQTLWNQYSGERRDYYYLGYYPETNPDGSITYKKSETKEDLYKTFDDPGRLAALEVLYPIYMAVDYGGYSYNKCDYLTFQQAQRVFLGLGYGDDTTKSAFMINGDWVYKEMQDDIEKAGVDIRFMKIPIISSITETLETENVSEETLRNVVSAVDAKEEWNASLGVSEADYDRISVLRYTGQVTADQHVMVVPRLNKNGAQYKLAEQFLKFVAGDTAQALFTMDQLGLSMPYGFDTTDFVFNSFTESVKEAMGDDFHMVANNQKYPIMYAGGLKDVGYVEGQFFHKTETPAEMQQRFTKINAENPDLLRLIK